MKKVLGILAILLIVIIIIIGIVYLKNGISEELPQSVVIIQNENQFSSNKGIETSKELVVDSKEDLIKFKNWVKNIKVLSGKEYVDLSLSTDIEIKYNENISICIQVGEKQYCYYKKNAGDKYSLAYMPDDLYNWVNDKLQEVTEKEVEDSMKDFVESGDYSEWDIVEDVDIQIRELTQSSQYKEMSYDEREKVCRKLLEKLENEGKIKFLEYSEQLKQFSFCYFNDVLGAVMIKDFDPMFN